jgi:hypothetical protein
MSREKVTIIDTKPKYREVTTTKTETDVTEPVQTETVRRTTTKTEVKED